MSGASSDRDHLRIVQMLEAAEEAIRDAACGHAEFVSDRRSRSVVLLDLIHLTESADKLSVAFKKLNPGIDWRRLSELRNRGLVHEYPDVDIEDIWRFVREELPRLKRRLGRVSFRERA